MHDARSIPLFWRVFRVVGALFTLVALLLLLSPVTISAPIAAHEAAIVVVSLVLLLVVNAIMLARALRPLQRLADRMDVVDLLRPGHRLQQEHGDEIGRVVRSFNLMLDRLESERQQSGRRMLRAQEAERRTIARDLHDEVGQLLTGVLLELDAASDTHPGSDLQAAAASARRALNEVRRISQALRPQLLEDVGLVSALTELCLSVERTTQTTIRREFERELPDLDSEMELVLYRIAQESLTNIARHAHATRVEVSLTKSGRDVVLRVSDDGVGIRPEDEHGGGLRGMRERSLLVGAAFAVRPSSTGGTEVRLEVPVERAQAGGQL